MNFNDNLENSIYRDIPDYPDYKINYNGDVLSLKNGRSLVLKQTMQTCGYYRVCLSKNKERNAVDVHRLMKTCFLNNMYPISDVVHKDGNRKNNCLWNLKAVYGKFRKKRKKNVLWYIKKSKPKLTITKREDKQWSGIRDIRYENDIWIVDKEIQILKRFVNLQDAINYKLNYKEHLLSETS